jgi:hypothetical protein
MPTFFVSFRTPKESILEPRAAEFVSLAEACEHVTACVRETVLNLADHESEMLTLACDICHRDGTVLATVQFKDMLLH